MNKILTLAAAATLAGASLSAGAWWGPYGVPYWGGYAPLYAAPAVTPWYGYGITQEQLQALAARQRQAAEHWTKAGYGPWGALPFSGAPGDFLDNPFMTPDARALFQRSEAERRQMLKEDEARQAAFRARVAAQKAAMDTRRTAWLKAVAAYNPYPPYGLPAEAAVKAPAEPAQTPSASAPAKTN
jgi:hypothetical protein